MNSATPKQSSMQAKLARARSATRHGILYGLGHGGEDPSSLLPSDDGNLCDCSGFALAWVQGISRTQEGKGKPWSSELPYINTDAVVADATGPQRLFVRLETPVLGCAVVYSKAMGGESCGHCAIVTGYSGKVLTGIDCHGGFSGHHVAAIEEHDLSYFLLKKALFVCLKEDLA